MRTSAVPLLGLACILFWTGTGCSSLPQEEEEFLQRHRWFFSAEAREWYRNDPDKREELRKLFRQQRKEQVRPERMEAVKAGQVELGMTRTEVLFSLGAPEIATSAQAGDRLNEWNEYEIGGERVTLAFENAVLEAILPHSRTPPGERRGPGGAPPDQGGPPR